MRTRQTRTNNRSRQAAAAATRQFQTTSRSGFSELLATSPHLATQRRQARSIQQSYITGTQQLKSERMITTAEQSAGGQLLKNPTVQLADNEEELMQGKFATKQLQALEEEEPMQGKFDSSSDLQRMEDSAAAPNNTGMPDNLKSGIESLSGMSMDDVRVHYNSAKPAQLNALAYAQGKDIHVASGQEQHLPHEAWHVVQQAQGRVSPTAQMQDGTQINDDAGLEKEADAMGEKALQTKRLEHAE